MSEAEQREEYEKQRRHQFHSQNLQSPEAKDNGVEILDRLSDLSDLPVQPQDDETIGQFASRVVSTANLSSEEVRSQEWTKEFILILYLCNKPTMEGIHSDWRVWIYADESEDIDPLSPTQRAKVESFKQHTDLADTRSQDAKAMEESTRNVSESIVNEPEEGANGSSGFLGRLKP